MATSPPVPAVVASTITTEDKITINPFLLDKDGNVLSWANAVSTLRASIEWTNKTQLEATGCVTGINVNDSFYLHSAVAGIYVIDYSLKYFNELNIETTIVGLFTVTVVDSIPPYFKPVSVSFNVTIEKYVV